MAEVLLLNGNRINWKKPPKPNALVMWSKRDDAGRKVIGSFRTIAHLNRTNNLARKRYHKQLRVIQPCYNKGVAASAGTHDFDACLDVYIPGVSWWEQQRFFRWNGWGAYYRRPPLFSNHIHMFSLPPREGKSVSDDYKVGGFKVGEFVDGGYSTVGRQIASSQIDDYYNHRSALAGHEKDPSVFPKKIEKTIFDLDKYVARRAA